MRNRISASEASSPCKKSSMASKDSVMVTSQNAKSSFRNRRYSKTAEDVNSKKVSFLKASKKSWKSKRSVKVKETTNVIERRNSEVIFKIRKIQPDDQFFFIYQGEKIINHYIILRQLGEGSFAKVKLAKRRFIDIEEYFAIKIFKQGMLNAKKINFNEKGGFISV